MKRHLIILSIVTLIATSCSDNENVDRSDPLISGRGFIEASLKGDYKVAEKYLLKDSTNMEYFQGLKNFNMKLDAETRQNYRNANIIIDSSIAKSDSVDIIYYSNSFKNMPSKIKLVKQNKDWLVDFKYTFTDN
ncbi:MAG: hypothetical protein ABI136_03630 [Ginsengibacter sp.]